MRRRDAWISSIVVGLQELTEKVDKFDIKSLSSNEEFISTVLLASKAAINTHHREKLLALRNAVLSLAITPSIEGYLRERFITYIDDFTPLHIQILEFVDNPATWFVKHKIVIKADQNTKFEDVLAQAFPTLRNEIKAERGNGNLVDVISTDLWSRRLIRVDYLLNAKGIPAYLTSDFGKQFLVLIGNPIPEKE